MGCQKKIAQEIHFGGGHYLLALKANQGNLHDDVRALFNDADALGYGRKKGHQVVGGARCGAVTASRC